ncbi:MAG: flippase [Leptolyngbyaceae cyanobacterium]
MTPSWLRRAPTVVRRKLAKVETQKILSNIGWLTIERLLRMVLGFGVGVWVYRYLGPTQQGEYSYAIAFTTIFGVIAKLGLNRVVIRDLVRFPDSQHRVMGTALALKILAAILTYFITLTSSYFVNAGDPQLHGLISIVATGIVFQALDPFDFWFQSKTQSKYAVYAKSAAFILISLVKIGLILLGASLGAFAWAGVGEMLITSIGLVMAYAKVGPSAQDFRYCHRTAKQLLRDSSPLILSGVMMMIYMRIDQLMVVRLASEREAGLYAAAVSLTEAWHFIPLVVIPSVFPSLINTWKVDQAAFHDKLQMLYNLMAALFYAIAIPTTLLSSWVIDFFLGVAYDGAGPMLAILIWSTFFVSLGTVKSHYLVAMNWPFLHFFSIGSGCIINVALNALLIPDYGGVAASATTLISYSFATYGSCFFSRKLWRTAKMMTSAIAFQWDYDRLLSHLR